MWSCVSKLRHVLHAMQCFGDRAVLLGAASDREWAVWLCQGAHAHWPQVARRVRHEEHSCQTLHIIIISSSVLDISSLVITLVVDHTQCIRQTGRQARCELPPLPAAFQPPPAHLCVSACIRYQLSEMHPSVLALPCFGGRAHWPLVSRRMHCVVCSCMILTTKTVLHLLPLWRQTGARLFVCLICIGACTLALLG